MHLEDESVLMAARVASWNRLQSRNQPMRSSANSFSALRLAVFIRINIIVIIAAQLFVLTSRAGSEESATGDAARAARIRTLVENLRSSSAALRQRTEAELVQFGTRALPALEEAAAGVRPELAERAQRVVARILESIVQLVDAAGQPIAGASLEIQVGPTIILEATDARGYFPLPRTTDDMARARVVVAHTLCGRALAAWESSSGRHRLRAPVALPDTPAFARSLVAVVVDGSGAPVAGAEVRCSSVRTPGEGLISGSGTSVLWSDDAGRFTLCLHDPDPDGERGDLIPPGSRYDVVIEPAAESGLFPAAGSFPNSSPARIVLERPEREFTLEFESESSDTIKDPGVLRRIRLVHQKETGSAPVDLGSRFAESGRGKLVSGIYRASLEDRAFLPVEVTDSSPATLRFRSQPQRRFRGRVVDGTTGEPVSGAIVFAYSGISRGNLALLGDAEWKSLRDPRTVLSRSAPAVESLRAQFGVDAITRTGSDGEYELLQTPSATFYSIIACMDGVLPFRTRVLEKKPEPDGIVSVADLPLFPAATVLVRPIFDRGALSVSPRWHLETAAAPEWIARLLPSSGPWEEHGPAYAHWLPLGEASPVFVPAGVLTRVEIESPYNDAWFAAAPSDAVRLKRGESRDLGNVEFAPALEVVVRVVGPGGSPVEGIPVRRMYSGGDNAWSVAHNTDADGHVKFWARPRSKLTFRAGDTPQDRAAARTVELDVGDESPSREPPVVELSASEIEKILGRRRDE
jgi:hypothetical protein